jgi:hypothetical protein
MAAATPTGDQPARPVQLPVEADAARIFQALQGAHDELEPVVCTVSRLEDFDGTKPEPELAPITEQHLAGLITIRTDLATLLDELEGFSRRLDKGIHLACVIRHEQQFQAQRAA